MSNKHTEIMDILQEECAEVIQAVSKCRRFGFDECYPTSGKSNRESLAEEVGDLLCMIDLLIDFDLVSNRSVSLAREAKKEKLKKWSAIYN